MHQFLKNKVRRNSRGSAIAEFAPTLFIIFLVTFFPLINLMGLAMGAATVVLLTNDAAGNAATQSNYAGSLAALYRSAENSLATGFAKFAKVQPMSGYQYCGVNLYIQITKLSTSATAMSVPNQPIPPPIDTTGSIYEVAAVSDYNIGPLISMDNVPIVSSIPGLGQPLRMIFRATRLAEHPQGLASNPSTNQSGGAAANTFARQLPKVSSTPNALAGAWRTPDIYQKIAAAGQTVIAQTVLLVPATSPWVSSGLTLLPGENLWIDTTSVGTWTGDTTTPEPNVDANGIGQFAATWGSYSSTTPLNFSLVGLIGAPPAMNTWLAPPPYNPALFEVGDQLLNYKLSGTGPLSFQINDSGNPGLVDNDGAQMVRIILTR